MTKQCEASRRPVFLSHSGARALFSERKLKSDGLLKAVAGDRRRDRDRGVAAHDDAEHPGTRWSP